MPPIEKRWSVSFALSAKNWADTKKGSAFQHLPSLRPCVGAPVALLQSRTLRTSAFSLPYSLSSLSQRGHLYFAEKGTFLLCIDMVSCCVWWTFFPNKKRVARLGARFIPFLVIIIPLAMLRRFLSTSFARHGCRPEPRQ
jgi:hypothetical protein